MKQESNRQKIMEDIDGGLHPAVYGQSLGERRKGMNQPGFQDHAFCTRGTRCDLGAVSAERRNSFLLIRFAHNFVD